MSIEARYEIFESKVTREVVNTLSGTSYQNNEIHIVDFMDTLSRYSYVDLGLLPDKVKFFRQRYGYAQVVIELEPGINRHIWGSEEGDEDADHYMLAQPYRVIILDFKNDQFFGARLFYSVTPIYDLDTPLYNANISNINCAGYYGNAVGWLCLYNNENMEDWTWEHRIVRMVERCSGEEAFNFENMSETDGVLLYRAFSNHSFLSSPFSWEAYSEKHGYEWTLNPDFWIPVKVSEDLDQSSNNLCVNLKDYSHGDESEYHGYPISELQGIDPFKADSIHLTLRMALDERYSATYEDSSGFKPPSPNYVLDNPNEVANNMMNSSYSRALNSKNEQPNEDQPF